MTRKESWWRGVSGIASILAFGATMWLAPRTSADIIYIESYPPASTSQLGHFLGQLEYGFNMQLNSWTLLVTLMNTSPPANGGFLTGFIFNINSTDSNASATLHSGTHPFVNAPNQGGQPIGGTYDAGAVLGGSFQGGGGNPNQGIAVGQTGSFLFTVSASDAPNLSALSFITGPETYNFLVRFRSFNHGHGSDKVAAQQTDGPGVPGPAGLMVLAIGAIGVRRRTRHS
jgi:hypothetical protein